MQRECHSQLHPLPTVRRWAGSCLALIYILGATPLVLALTTLLATADRSHHVAVHQAAGGIQLVLLHNCVNSPTHRHGIVARTLTLMAQRPIAGHPDHVIDFAASTVSQLASAPALAPTPDSPATQIHSLCDLYPRPSPLTPVAAARSRPTPDADGRLRSLRSTVLLI